MFSYFLDKCIKWHKLDKPEERQKGKFFFRDFNNIILNSTSHQNCRYKELRRDILQKTPEKSLKILRSHSSKRSEFGKD